MNDESGIAGTATADTLDIGALLARVLHKRMVLLTCVAAGLLSAIVYMHVATRQYTATLKIGPAPTLQSSPSATPSGSLSSLASLAGLGGQAGQNLSPFELYLETIMSRDTGDALARHQDLMRAMFPREWDATSGKWRSPPSVWRTILNAVRTVIGTPLDVYRPPDGARMQTFIQSSVGIEQDPKKTLVTLSFSYPDAKFAAQFLDALNKAVDNQLRQKAQQHADQYISYLSNKLETITNADHRLVLMQVMSEQERFRMMASSHLPYAADVYDGPSVSPYVTSPKPVIVLALGIVGGLFAGIGLALFLTSELVVDAFGRH